MFSKPNSFCTPQKSFLAEVGVVGSFVMEDDLPFLPAEVVSSESVEVDRSRG